MNKEKWAAIAVLVLVILLATGCAPGVDKLTDIGEAVSQTVSGALSPVESAADFAPATIPFELQVIDEAMAGDVKLVGDIDGDGLPDLVIGGMPNEQLNWYRYPDWQKTVIATPANEFTTDGALGDVDGDGDLDIVVPDGNEGENLLWFENPLPAGDPGRGEEWTRRVIGAIGSWGKDVELADFDGDGRLDAATRSDGQAMIFFQIEADQWQATPLSGVELGYEGMGSGDVDGDGNVDLVLRGAWLRNPGDAANDGQAWASYSIGDAPENFKALVADLNADGQADVLFSSSEDTADVKWWTPQDGDPTGPWIGRTILPNLEKGHTLQVADMDLDGDVDVVLGQMHTSTAGQLMIMLNIGGEATTWQKQVIGEGGIHNGVVADIGADGDYDIYGANWTGNPPLRLWINGLDQAGPLDRWTYKQVAADHAQTFGLGFGDVDGDGEVDIVSGRYWYRNPGGEMLGDWRRGTFPDGMHAFLFLDVDGDDSADVLAQKDEGDIALYWLEAEDATGESWNAVRVGAVEQASHSLGAQGYDSAPLQEGSSQGIVISSGNGAYLFRIPADPSAGNWPRIHISANPSDEGVALGDVNGDGLLDVAATTGDSKRVEWYRNPGDDSDDWEAFHVGTFDEAVYPDRIALADLSGDGKLDIIVTEENGGEADAETYWWEQPADPTSRDWPRHLIATQATTNSLDVADMNGDGAVDVALAEHRGGKRLAVWLNDGRGNLTEQPIDEGKESHLGARLIDLDGDGDLDIVSIAWDEYSLVHLWRNDSRIPDETAHIPAVLAEAGAGAKSGASRHSCRD